MFLIYDTEDEAWNRSEQEGIRLNLSYHSTGKGSRFVTAPQLTADLKYALAVDLYTLSDEEAASTVETFTPAPTEEE